MPQLAIGDIKAYITPKIGCFLAYIVGMTRFKQYSPKLSRINDL